MVIDFIHVDDGFGVSNQVQLVALYYFMFIN